MNKQAEGALGAHPEGATRSVADCGDADASGHEEPNRLLAPIEVNGAGQDVHVAGAVGCAGASPG